MFSPQFAFIPLTFALLMNHAEPQKQANAIEFECAGVAQEQLAAIAAEIAANHEPAIVPEYLKWYCLGFQAMQESRGNEVGVGFFLRIEGDQLASLYTTAYGRGALDAQRSVSEPDQ